MSQSNRGCSLITGSLQMDTVCHSPDLLSETQYHLVSSVLQFVLVALEVPEDLVHPNVQEDGSLLQARQNAIMACISILKVISKNLIMIIYSLFHLWVLGNSNPYYPAKSITHQPLDVTNEQQDKQNSAPPPSMRERKYLRSRQPWWTRRSLLKKETTKKVTSKHFVMPLCVRTQQN